MTSLGETALRDLPSDAKKESGVDVDVDQFLAELSNAAASGATDLPSAAIPANTTAKQQIDKTVIANTVPDAQPYIEKPLVHLPSRPVVAQPELRDDSTDSFDILTLPVLSGLLFILVQQPLVRKQLISLVPSSVGKDGDLSFGGLLLTGGAIASIVYGVQEYVLGRSTSR